jgi:hypothetical protein
LPAAPELQPVNDLLTAYTSIGDRIKAAKERGIELARVWKDLGKDRAALVLATEFDRTLRMALEPMRELVEKQRDEAAYQREYGELLAQGTLPALAQQLATINATYTKAKELIDYEILRLETAIKTAEAEGAVTTELEKQLEVFKERAKLLGTYKDSATEGAKSAQSPGQRLQGAYDKVQGELNELKDPVNQIVAGANAIGSAFGTAFKDVASGAKSAQQALADAFQGIANHFLDMASQMIAKWIEMQIIGLATSLLGAAAGAAGGPTGAAGSKGYTLPGGGGYAQGFSMPKIYEGGGYTGDAPRAGGLDGKGGFPAVLHPGETVVDHRASSARAALKGGGGGAAPTINIQTGNVVQFEGANYVSMADFEAGLAKAANQGAERGHRKTLDRLRQSPSTRRSLGM